MGSSKINGMYPRDIAFGQKRSPRVVLPNAGYMNFRMFLSSLVEVNDVGVPKSSKAKT